MKFGRGNPHHFIEALERRRLLANTAGALDTTFGPDGTGYTITDIGGGTSYALNDMAIGASGRIILVGDIAATAGSSDIYVLAYNRDGALDPGFGVGGKLIINFGTTDSARAVAIQSDGKIVIGGFTVIPGTTLGEDLLLTRLNSDGTFDTSFGNAGRTITDIARFNDRLLDITLQPDGKIVGAASNSFSSIGRVVRYLSDGTLDPTFGNGGFAASAPFIFPSPPTGLMLQSDGKIVIGGQYRHSTYGNILSFGRFNPDGTPDSSFTFAPGADPIVSIGSVVNFALLPDGRFLASTGSDLVRVNPDGSHDLTFSTGGVWRGSRGTPVQPGDVRGLVLDSMGKILSTGFSLDSTGQDVVILRQHDNGLPDPSFGNQAGFDRINLGGKPEQGFAAALQSEDRLVVAGLTTNGTQKAFLMRVDDSNVPNVPPIADAGGPYTVREGGLIRLNGSATDSDGGIDHYEWDFNYDGVHFDVDATDTRDIFNPLGRRPLFDATGIDGPSTRTIALRVFDSQYAATIVTTTLTVTNSAPALLASGSPRIVPGQPYPVTFSASPDPGPDTISSWQIDWGDGSALQVLPASATNASHIFADSNHPYHITVSATDEDGTYMANRAMLDPTYGNGSGFSTQTHWWDSGGFQGAVDPFTGKLYVLGSPSPFVFRYNPDGTPDMTWGTAGVVAFDGNATNEDSGGLSLQPDGDILVWAGYGDGLYVGRFDVFGRRDLSFGQAGVVFGVSGQPFGDRFGNLTSLPDGGFIMAGINSAYPNQLVVTRYTSAGLVDTSFGANGYVRTQVIPGIDNRPSQIYAQPDGRILAYVDSAFYSSAYLIRFNSDGTLDTTFGPDDAGYAPFSTTSPTRSGTLGITSQPDGKIIAWYNVPASNLFPDYDFGLLRLTNDGILDTSFGTGGRVSIDLSGTNDYIGEVFSAPDGGLLISGTMGQTANRPLILKLTDSGQLDPTFANGGMLPVQNGSGGLGQLLVQDDKLFSLGSSSRSLFNARVNYGPILARANDPPEIPTVTSGDSIDEGSPYSISGTISDLDAQDIHLLTINWGDGGDPSYIRLAAGVTNWSAQHVYGDDNPSGTSSDLYSITITADDGLDSVSTVRSVRVMNVAPIAELGPDRAGIEGDSFVFNPTRIDPSPTDTFTYVWSADRSNGTLVASGTLNSFTFVAPDNDTYTIRLKLTDDDGGEWNDSVAVTTLNAPPLVSVGADKSGPEGTAISVTPGYSDKGSADTSTYKWNIYKPDGSLGWTYSNLSLSFTPPDNGSYRAVLTVTDDDGGVGSDEMLLFISNVAPTLRYAADSGAYQGKAYQVSLNVTDPGTDTISSWTINWGDGSPTEIIQGSLGPLSHVYTALATGVRITGSGTDEDGTYSISTKTINVVPLPTLTADGTLLITGTPQNDTLSLALAPGSDRLQVSLTGAITDYPLADVARFEASLGNGNDLIIFPTSGIPGGIVRGEDGADTMTVNAPLSSPIQFIGGQTSTFLDVLNVNAGTFVFNSDPRVSAGRLNLVVTAASVVFNTTAHLEGLVLSNASRATIALNSSRFLQLISLSIGGGSVLDLTDNDLIMQPPAANAASVASTIGFLLKQAYNGPTRWQDASLTSSWAAANSSRTLGFMRNLGPKFPTFDGEPVDVNSILVAHTVVGDLNLDRRVTISDFIDLSANFGETSTTWISGDVNYDTQTTIADFIELSSYFGQSLPPAASPAAPLSADLSTRLGTDLPHHPRRRRHLHHATPRLVRRFD